LVFGVEIGLLIAYLLWQFIGKGKELSLSSIIVCQFIPVFAAFYLLWSYIGYTSNTWEVWITQASWYIRDNGLVLGGVLGAYAGVSLFLIYWLLALCQKLQKEQQILVMGTLLVFIAFHLSLFNGLFSSAGLFNILVFCLIEFAVVASLNAVHFMILGESSFTQELSNALDKKAEGGASVGEEMQNSIDSTSRYLKTNSRWFFLFLLLQIVMWAVTPLYYPIKPDSLLIFSIPFIAGLLLINYWSLASKLKRRNLSPILRGASVSETSSNQKPSLAQKLSEQIGIFILGIFEVVRVIAPFYMVIYVSYGFPTPFKMLEFHQLFWKFAVIGAVLFIIMRKTTYLLKLVYIACLFGLAWLIILINADVVLNMYTYYGNFETIYPFQVLLSPLHASLAGFATGFILCYEFTRIVVRYVDRSNMGIRGILIVMLFFLLGLAMGALGPQGVFGGRINETGYHPYDWDRTDPFVAAEFLENAYLVTFIVIASLIGLFFIMDLLVPKIIGLITHRKNIKSDINKEHHVFPTRTARSRKATIIMSILLISLIPATIFFLTRPEIKNGYALPLVSSEKGVNVYAAPSYIRVGPDQPLQPKEGGLIEYYELKMAKNEYESVQLIIAPERRALNGFRYMVSNFVDASTGLSIDSGHITVRYIENVIDGQYPDRLVPFNMLHLTEPRNHGIWITAYVPYSASAGLYSGIINFTFGDKESFVFNLRLNVWNFTIPQMRHTRTNLGPQTSNQNHIDTFHSHRINSYGIPVHRAWSEEQLNANEIYTCFLNETTNQWSFNWTWWDAQTNASILQGVNGFYINCPLGMPREPWWFEEDGVTLSKWGIQTGNFYAGVQAHLEDLRDNNATDWFKYCYIYFIDEFQMFIPEGYEREEYFVLLEGFLSLINSSAPNVKIMTTTPPSRELLNIRKYIDIYCPVTYDYDEVEWNAAMAEGKEMWMYPCVGPQAPWPNSHLYNRLFEIRVLYWQVFYYKIQGFLYWSSNAYYHGQYGMGFNAWGDGWFVYMDDEGRVYDSIRWENYRDAIEDYEYLWLLNASLALLSNSEQNLAALNAKVSAVTRDRYHYCGSGDIIVQNRNLIGDQLSTLQNSGAIDLLALGETEWVF
jgi:hypothetical protein